MNNKTTPKDFFLHLGALVSLYVSVGFFISLCFSVINRWYPDNLYAYYSPTDIITALSTIIVSIPILYVLEYLLNKDIKLIPEKRDIMIRKFRIYLTLFLAGLTAAIDIIMVLNSYLRGELTSRFGLKITTVLLVSIIVFVFYLFERMSDSPNFTATKAKIKKTISYLGLVLAIASIIAAFIAIGSPKHQRNIRMDSQKINDLRNIKQSIIYSYQDTGKLPASIADLKYGRASFVVTEKDPESDKNYEYNILSKSPNVQSFELCAEFNEAFDYTKDRKQIQDYYSYDNSYYTEWNHGAGRQCFATVLDPEKYPLKK